MNEGVKFLENLFGFVEKALRQKSLGRSSAEASSNRLHLFFLRVNCLFEKSPKRPFPETFPLSLGSFQRLSEVQAFLLSKLFPSLEMRGHWAELREPKRWWTGTTVLLASLQRRIKRIRLEKREKYQVHCNQRWFGIAVSNVFVNKTCPIHSSNCTWDQFEINTEVLAPLNPRSYQECDFTSCEDKRKAQVCCLSLFWQEVALYPCFGSTCPLSLFWVNK